MVEASPSFPSGAYTACIVPPIRRSKEACAAIQDSRPAEVVKAFHTESSGALTTPSVTRGCCPCAPRASVTRASTTVAYFTLGLPLFGRGRCLEVGEIAAKLVHRGVIGCQRAVGARLHHAPFH